MNCTVIPILSCSSTNGICNVKNCHSPIHNLIVMDDSWIASHLNTYLSAVIEESADDVKGLYPAAFRYLKNHPEARKHLDPSILYNAYRNGKVRMMGVVYVDVGLDARDVCELLSQNVRCYCQLFLFSVQCCGAGVFAKLICVENVTSSVGDGGQPQ